MSQRMMIVTSSVNGSIIAVLSSGIKIMSDSLIPFQPAIEEPSNIFPSTKKSSLTSPIGIETCCSLPLVSVNRRSIQRASLSLIRFRVFSDICSSNREFVVRYFRSLADFYHRAACLQKISADFSNDISAIVVPIGQCLRQSTHILSL